MKTKQELAVSYLQKCKGDHYENHIDECFSLWGKQYGKKFVQEVKTLLATKTKAK